MKYHSPRWILASVLVTSIFLPPSYNAREASNYFTAPVSSNGLTASVIPGSLAMPQENKGLQITFNNDHIPQSQTPCDGSSPSWTFQVTVRETAGRSISITDFTLDLFDHEPKRITFRPFSADDFARIFSGCGGGRAVIPPGGSACGTLCVNLGGHPRGFAVITISWTVDDRICTTSKSVSLEGPVINQGADLTISSTASAGNVGPQSAFFYTIKVTNTGPDTANGVVVTDSLSPGTTFKAAAVSQGVFAAPSGANAPLRFSLNSIPPGASATIWIVVSVNAQPEATLTNLATVSASSVDPSIGDNRTENSLLVSRGSSLDILPVNLSVSSTASPQIPVPGTRITYTITVKNNGPDRVISQGIINLLPAGTTFASMTGQTGNCIVPPVGGRGVIICPISLSPDEVEVITISANVIASGNTLLANRVEVVDGTGFQPAIETVDSCRILGGPVLIIVTFSSDDTNPNDDQAIDGRKATGGGIVTLVLEQPPSTPADPTPAPRFRQLLPGMSDPTLLFEQTDFHQERRFALAEGTCTLIGYNVYSSDQSVVLIAPANLSQFIPPPPTMPTGFVNVNSTAGPNGTNYKITAVYRCASGEVESNSTEQVGVPPGPVIESLEPGSKLKIKGSGFVGPLEITVDGVRYSKTAKIKNGGRQVVQKGKLANGRSLADTLAANRTVLLSIRNGTGGIASYSLSQ